MTTQQMWSGNRVEALPPSPGDMFVVTLLFGKRFKIQPVSEYQQAKNDAHSFGSSNRMGTGAYTMKVLSLTLEETLTLCGISRAELFADMTPADDTALKQQAVAACMDVLRESNDATVRKSAFDLLYGLGALPQ
jgi:hypothetical protein